MRVNTVKAYLLAIARNLYRDALRRQSRLTQTGEVPERADRAPLQDRTVEDRQALSGVLKAIQKLPEPQREALVLSVDEKSQIQALDRTQPSLPLKTGHGATITSDYKRNGTTTLFAALDTANGEVYGFCQQKHRHQEWLKFLGMIDDTVSANKEIHIICDNYSTHKHANVKLWLEQHKRFHVHFTPTSSSLNPIPFCAPS